MNTKINLTYDGVDYTLEYDRNTIKLLENAGFRYDEFMSKPMTNMDLAFTAAFIKNHRKTSSTTIDAIYAACPDKDRLIATISKMIEECYDALMSEPDKDDSKKVTWETVDSTPLKKEKSQE